MKNISKFLIILFTLSVFAFNCGDILEDTSAINPVSITNITAAPSRNSAVITWNTDAACTHIVEYGLTSGIYTSATVESASPATSHSEDLAGLYSETVYYYRIKVFNPANNGESWSAEQSFTTSAISITGGIAATPSITSATITWTTDYACTHIVEYGTATGTYTSATTQTTAGDTSHAATITGLSANTQYYYRIKLFISDYLDLTTAEGTFTTLPTTTIAISAIDDSTVTTTTATISWTTDIACTYLIEYGTASGNYSMATVQSVTEETDHSVSLTSLQTGAVYYYRIKVFNSSNEAIESAEQNFTTSSFTISGINCTPGTNSAAVIWTTSASGTHLIVYGTTSNTYTYSTVETASLQTSHSETLSGLNAGTYYYRIKVYNSLNEEVTSGEQSFATSGFSVTNLTATPGTGNSINSATVTWTTNINCTSLVEYGTTTGVYAYVTPESSTPGTSHNFTLTGLSPGTLYYYRIKLYNSGYLNYSSAEYNFTAGSITISGITPASVTYSSETISWTTNISCTHWIEYGTTIGGPYATTIQTSTPGTSHSETLTGLTGNTTYYYRIRIYSSTYGYYVYPTEQNFTTIAETAPTMAQKLRGIWIVGGAADLGGGTIYNQIDLYDPVTETWYSDVAASATGTYNPSAYGMAVSVGEKIYSMGGATSSSAATNTVYEYDIASNSWSTKDSVPVNLVSAAVYINGDYIYLMGGTTWNPTPNSTANVVTTHYKFDPNGTPSSQWTSVPPAAYATARASMAVNNFNGMVCYAGGRVAAGGSSTTNDIYLINSDTYTSSTEQVITSRGGMAYAGYSGAKGTYFFLIGGASAFGTGTLTSFFNNNFSAGFTYVPQANSFQVYLPPSIANGILNGTAHPSFSGGVTGLVYASAVVSPYNGSTSITPTLYVFGGIKTIAGPATSATSEVNSMKADGTASGTLYESGTPWSTETAMPRARFGHTAVIINQ